MATTETPLISLQQVEAWDDDIRAEFARLVNQRQEYSLAEEEAKAKKADLDQSIAAILSLIDGNYRVQSDLWVVQRITNTGKSSISKTRLVELGVSASVIAQATSKGEPYSYIVVKPTKE